MTDNYKWQYTLPFRILEKGKSTAQFTPIDEAYTSLLILAAHSGQMACWGQDTRRPGCSLFEPGCLCHATGCLSDISQPIANKGMFSRQLFSSFTNGGYICKAGYVCSSWMVSPQKAIKKNLLLKFLILCVNLVIIFFGRTYLKFFETLHEILKSILKPSTTWIFLWFVYSLYPSFKLCLWRNISGGSRQIYSWMGSLTEFLW
jgi:hypothetical protein